VPPLDEKDHFFALSIDLLGVAGLDGYWKRVNPAFEKTLGFTETALLAQPYMEFVHPEDHLATTQVVEKLNRGEPLIYFENRLRCKDGAYKWLAWTCAPAEGLLYAIGRDITERKRIERALRESETGFRLLFANNPHPMWVYDLEMFFAQSLDGFFFMVLDEPVRWDDTVDKEKVLDYVFAHKRMTKINDAMLAQYGGARAVYRPDAE